MLNLLKVTNETKKTISALKVYMHSGLHHGSKNVKILAWSYSIILVFSQLTMNTELLAGIHFSATFLIKSIANYLG